MKLQTAIDKHWSVLEKLLYGLVLIGLITGSVLMGGRFAIEQNYNQVEIAIHYEDLVEESRLSGLSMEDLLLKYQEAGATSLWVKEYDIETLKDQTSIASGLELYWDGLPAYPELSYLMLPEGALADNIRLNLEIRDYLKDDFTLGAMTYLGTDLPLSSLWSLQAYELTNILGVGMGWPLEDMHQAEKIGYYLQLQIKDWENPSQESLSRYFSQFESLGQVSLFLFNSSDLFGYSEDPKVRTVFPVLAEEISKKGAEIGQVEFFKQLGFENLAEEMKEKVVRVHSIAENELRTMTQTASVERYMLAVKDRNMRSLFVRGYESGQKESWSKNVAYVKNIAEGIENQGFVAARAKPITNLFVPEWAILLLSVGVLAAAVLLSHYWGLTFLGILGFILGILMSVSLVAMQECIFLQKMMALLAGCIFPLLGVTFVLENSKEKRSIPQSILGLLLMSAVTLVGAVFVVGLLRERAFMLGLNLFTGVKLTLSLPLAGLLVYYFLERKKEELIILWKELLNRPLSIKILLIVGLAAGILGVYILRTGNAGLVPSSLETAARRLLEQVTMARPRTKEFMIGHPLMLVGLSLGFRFRTLPFFLLGMIGQVSMLNTFTHLHTPLMISLLRSTYGLIIGIILGVVIWKIAHMIYARWKR